MSYFLIALFSHQPWKGREIERELNFYVFFYLFVGWGKKKRLVGKSANAEDGRLMS